MATLVTWDEFTSGARPQGGTIPEIVMPEVTNIISKDRPLLSALGSKPVQGLFIELLTDELASRAHNATVEGAAFTDPALTQPTRHFVHVQSFAKWGRVSDEQRITLHYNADPFSYQGMKSMQELLNDIEHALHQGTATTGATNAARQFAGAIDIFTNEQSGTATWTDSSGTTLTEEVWVDYIQAFRDQSLALRPTQAYVNSWIKRTISEFSTRVTRNVDASERLQELIVERHASDFGNLDIFYAEDQLKSDSKTTSGNSLIFIDPSKFKVGFAKPPTFEQLSRDGFRDRYQINAHATLLYSHAKGGGGATGLVPYLGQA